MKKIITFGSIIIISIVLFSSCESNMSITKRHYNNGYYIANSKMKHDNNQKKIETAIPTKTILSSNSIQNKIESNAINMDSVHNSFIDKNDMVASNNKMPGKTNTHNKIKNAVKQQAEILRHSAKQNKRNVFRKNKVKDDSTDDALSLLWIVIVVILILWLVGFLLGGFGLGGIFNLLLLIALILLVLWLLRIV